MVFSRILNYFLLSFLLINQSMAQSVYPENCDTSFSMESKILHEKLKVFAYLPIGYDLTTATYPVVYVLDGEYYFSFASQAASLLEQNEIISPCIVIGITTNNRQRDFAPKVDDDSGQTQDLQTAGGADHFLEYLEKELIPTVEKQYRTQPYRVLVGHSLGGLLAYYSLYTKPDLFQAYIALDASTWWNKGRNGKEVMNYLSKNPNYKGKIFECRKDLKIPVRFPANAELLDYLDKKRPEGLEYRYLELENETHGTIVFPGVYYGLKYILGSSDKK